MENTHLKFLVESKVPFLRGVLEPYGAVDYADPEDITPGRVRDVDAMIVRTRTHAGEALLGGSRCSFVATATIGTDHIDAPWCAAHGIAVANAPGCNAPAVAQYVLGSVAALHPGPLAGLVLGGGGGGHVGSIVGRWGRSLGMRVMEGDPPRERGGGGGCWGRLAGVGSGARGGPVRTPPCVSAAGGTFHLAGEEFFASLRRRPVVVNAARGAVVDTPALVAALDSGLVGAAVIDCWEGEPAISPELLQRAAVATPHIAGYSREGKWRASQMAVDAVAAHFGLPHIVLPGDAPAPTPDAVTEAAVRASYNPLEADTPALRSDPSAFERLRNGYALRAELREG